MKLVYIAGPISKGDLAANINQGTDAFIALLKAGVAAICPQWSSFSGRAVTADPLYNQSVDIKEGNTTADITGRVFSLASATPNDLTHSQWLAYDFQLIARCDAMLRLPGESVGADLETGQADLIGLPVFRSVEDVITWAHKDG